MPLRGHDVSLPFRRLPYREAMEKYGSDKPDLRIPYTIEDFTAAAASWNSDLLNTALAAGAKVKGLVIPDAGGFSRKQLDEINETGKKLGGKGVIWMKKGDDGFKASLKIAPEAIAVFLPGAQDRSRLAGAARRRRGSPGPVPGRQAARAPGQKVPGQGPAWSSSG